MASSATTWSTPGRAEGPGALRYGLQVKLGLSVLVSTLLSAFMIAGSVYQFGRDRVDRAYVAESEAMVQAASLAFSQALGRRDFVLLDALVHELQSRRRLRIQQAYVLDPTGRVVAHSIGSEYGKHYPVPALLRARHPSRLSQVVSSTGPTFKVVSLLQTQGHTLGALVVRFDAAELEQRLRSEVVWVLETTLPILLLSGIILLLLGRGMTRRLQTLRTRIRAVGRGERPEPVPVLGNDEVAQLSRDFNQMQKDLEALQEKDRDATETIRGLNRELTTQLRTVERLKEQLAEENSDLREQLRGMAGDAEFLGASAPVRKLLEQAAQTAGLPINVLITGESGTGKELLASYIHRRSGRESGPFVKINCAALPVNLVESELFGHEKGAFTGAVSQRVGKFQLAHGGTLLLDEVGELPPESQSKLLRALQQGEIQRVGGSKPIVVDVRVIAATNRDLAEDVRRGTFREDLYYRLKVIELRCPALRERIDDLPILAQHFIEQFGRKLGRSVVGISPSALRRLGRYHWPGNVRELEHAVARAVALSGTRVLGPEDFDFLPVSGPSGGGCGAGGDGIEALARACGLREGGLGEAPWARIMAACERVCLTTALDRNRNQKDAAAMLGITPTKIHRLIRKHRLKGDPQGAVPAG